MEFLPVLYAIVLVVLTVVLTAVGIYMVLVLIEARRALHKLNTTLDTAEAKLNAFTQPLQRMGGMATGLSTGLRVFESFVGWLQRSKDRD